MIQTFEKKIEKIEPQLSQKAKPPSSLFSFSLNYLAIASLMLIAFVVIVSLWDKQLSWSLLTYGLFLLPPLTFFLFLLNHHQTTKDRRNEGKINPLSTVRLNQNLDQEELFKHRAQQAKEEEVLREQTSAEEKEKILQLISTLPSSLPKESEEEKRLITDLKRLESLLAEKDQKIFDLQGEFDNKLRFENKKNRENEELIQEQQNQLNDYKKKVAKQQQELQRWEELTTDLEKRLEDCKQQLHDQSYEIKTLLQISERDPLPEPSDEFIEEAEENSEIWKYGNQHQKLFQALDRATNFNAPSFYSKHHAPLGQHMQSSHTIDLQRLYEWLQSQQQACFILYHPHEEKLLFCSHMIKELCEWKADTFTRSFFTLLGDQATLAWKRAIAHLPEGETEALQLHLPTPTGKKLPLSFLLSSIPSGLFRHLIIGLVSAL